MTSFGAESCPGSSSSHLPPAWLCAGRNRAGRSEVSHGRDWQWAAPAVLWVLCGPCHPPPRTQPRPFPPPVKMKETGWHAGTDLGSRARYSSEIPPPSHLSICGPILAFGAMATRRADQKTEVIHFYVSLLSLF